ncbi:MAG: hypothetical protein NC390_07245 [Fusobacterium sp.]|nr:hypothetical protein [Fusobacterium sp.]
MNNRNVLTLSGGGGSLTGFTMAEILLSLTIIGVVAAITLPSLTGNINERTWNTQRKALYARFSQAIALMPALNGYGTLNEATSEDTAAETFIADGLSKVLKINNICDSEHLEDCGIPTKITPYEGSIISPFPKTLGDYNASLISVSFSTDTNSGSYSQLNTKAAAFETANGESVAVYYNPSCLSDLKSGADWDPAQARMCVNFVYDLNGTKGPNTMGKDIGYITVFYPTDSVVVAPYPYTRDSDDAPQISSGSSKSASQVCTSLDGGEWRLPSIDEAAALFVNKGLAGNFSAGSHYWTSSVSVVNGSTKGLAMSVYSGAKLQKSDRGSSLKVRCVKR